MLFDVLGLRKEQDSAGSNEALDGVVKLLLTMRAEAKASKNFALSDKIRDQLTAVGITIKDTKEGSTWEHA
jgi:cysteinyl-tRNA synthetase